jgi:hypothetical protein
VTNRLDPAKQLDTLRKILAAEAAGGYRDVVVHGGLDRFLENIRAIAKHLPALQTLDEMGLLSVGYRTLTAEQRQRWVGELERRVGETPPPRQRARAPATPARERQPRRPHVRPQEGKQAQR